MSKAQKAVEAIKANPQKSNRAIADEAGVSEGTVRTARKATAPDGAVEPRTGLDGKQGRMPDSDDRTLFAEALTRAAWNPHKVGWAFSARRAFFLAQHPAQT